MNRYHLIALVLASALANGATREDEVLLQGMPAGQQSVTPLGGGTMRADFAFNDRGRGDHIVATWKLDAAALPVEYAGHGNDYMKARVDETFRVAGGNATWNNRSEHGSTPWTGAAFYVPVNAPPEFIGVLARALLRSPAHRLALLPAGTAAIEAAGTVAVELAGGQRAQLTQYLITGVDFSPVAVWLDERGETAVFDSGGWFSVLAGPYRASLATLQSAQAVADTARAAQIARTITHVPAGDLLIRHARLFDPRDLSVRRAMSVLVHGSYVVRVAPDEELPGPAGAEIIDAADRFLMPGLWDNHQHFSGNDGALDLLNGVTSARDMANDTDRFLERVARFEAGSELGPHVFKAGMIDGTGPLAGPTKMRVDNEAEALADVEWYAAHGYGQIKIYSSVKPALMPIIADAAHARGLRVSGHVPAFMTARQFVAGGADEIQHLNFIVLNFLFDKVQDTRDMSRFTAVAQHVHELAPDSPQVQEFIVFLRQHHTVLDPTVNFLEAMFCADPTAVTPGLEAVAPRLPAQVRRGALSGALVVPKGQEAAYREAFPALLRLLKALYEGGVTIIPGTDSMSGYLLHHELELYARAGIPPAEVLRMATLTSARVSGAEADRGYIAPGHRADMILVDGDPSTNMADIHNVELVVKSGNVFDPALIETSLGIAPRAAHCKCNDPPTRDDGAAGQR
jgi:imidazolonepropionase-like amidohydrolase